MKVPFWKLLVAYLMDWVIFSIIAGIINFPMGMIFGAMIPEPNTLLVIVTFFSIISSLATFLLYFSLMEYFFHASVGKLVMKIVVAPKIEQ